MSLHKNFCRSIFKIFLPVVLLSLCIISCDKTGSFISFSATGAPGEVLMVMPDDWINEEPAVATESLLRSEVPALPQVEPWMRVMKVKQKDFNSTLRNTRNILFIDFRSDIYSHTSVKYSFDPYATGQIFVKIQTPSRESLQEYYKDHGRDICDLFLRNELFRMAKELSKDHSQEAQQLMKKALQHYIDVPIDVTSSKLRDNFIWLSNNAMRKRYDFAAFRLPLSKVGTITATRIIALRDSVLGSQIEGSEPGSKICTSTFGAEFRSAKLPNNATPFYELRGLWETTGTSMMAGPFVAHIYPDQKNNILYYVEGFVYHPNEKKRNIIRNLQAALFSFRPDSIDEYEPEEIKKVQWGKIEKINNEVTSHTVTDNTDL